MAKVMGKWIRRNTTLGEIGGNPDELRDAIDNVVKPETSLMRDVN